MHIHHIKKKILLALQRKLRVFVYWLAYYLEGLCKKKKKRVDKVAGWEMSKVIAY